MREAGYVLLRLSRGGVISRDDVVGGLSTAGVTDVEDDEYFDRTMRYFSRSAGPGRLLVDEFLYCLRVRAVRSKACRSRSSP